jgi:hypothetical protein
MLSNRLHRMSAAAAAKTRRGPRRQNANENGPASASARGSFPFPFFSFAEAPFGNRPSSSMTVRSRTREEAPAPLYDTRALTNERERFEKHWWMIHPFSRFRRRWDVTVVFATAYVALLAPFVIGFDVDAPRGSALFFFDRVVDGAFFLDVLLNYFTGFVETNRGRVVLEPSAVAWTYTKTWAPLDALASVPFDLVFPDEETNMRETEYAYGSHTESLRVLSVVPAASGRNRVPDRHILTRGRGVPGREGRKSHQARPVTETVPRFARHARVGTTRARLEHSVRRVANRQVRVRRVDPRALASVRVVPDAHRAEEHVL